ncbi:hypothetical protein SSX86_030047 [Deinandra increscens subsp. villosa]|uniref:Uncharacterized protein n=1 Tax=Deinandra increscens subsp. villosa TaxID=3103831 RepID=A0AAP0GKM6_9ASTR
MKHTHTHLHHYCFYLILRLVMSLIFYNINICLYLMSFMSQLYYHFLVLCKLLLKLLVKSEKIHTHVCVYIYHEEGRTYFHDLFNTCGDQHGTREISGSQHRKRDLCYCRKITTMEVGRALKKMGKAKSVGPDNIPIGAWIC